MLSRAKHHLADLETQIKAFSEKKPWTPVVEKDGTDDVLKVKFSERLSEDIPNIVFDCANNLRTVLDQAAFAIGRKHTGLDNPKSAKFPFGPTEDDMRNNLAGGCKDLPPEISGLFAAFKPYKGGNNALWAMNELCNVPKHKMLYPISIGGGVGVGGNAIVNTMLLGGGWNSEKDELIYARIPAGGVQGQLNFNLTFSVAFDQVDEVIRGQNPIKALRAMTGEVERVLVVTERECRRIAAAKGQKRTCDRLFDHLVGGGEQGLWESQAQRLCRFQIQHQLQLRWSLYRQFGRPCAS
jgi:hypothetical protein